MGHQTTLDGELPKTLNRRDAGARRQRSDLGASAGKQWGMAGLHAMKVRLPRGREHSFELHRCSYGKKSRKERFKSSAAASNALSESVSGSFGLRMSRFPIST